MKIKIDGVERIDKLPLSVVPKLRLERAYMKFAKSVKRSLRIPARDVSRFYPLVRNNRLYGDEFLLRRYAGLTRDLYSIIEHGLYFGKNRQKVSIKLEWELGCILTGGNYRRELIAECFPDYYCETIGPMIHYARVDESFKDEITSRLAPGEKTLLYFPIHGSRVYSPEYDAEMAVREAMERADEMGYRNVIICAYFEYIPLFDKFAEKYKADKRVVVTTNGDRFNEDFLDRQKTLISLADCTLSNNLGTHIGYCVYLGKPHILLPKEHRFVGDKEIIEKDFGDSNLSSNYHTDYEREVELFRTMFDGSSDNVTEEQYNLCDYYWGFSQVKTPEEIRKIAAHCEAHAKEFIRRSKQQKKSRL